VNLTWKAAFDQGNCIIFTSPAGRANGKKTRVRHVGTALLKGFERNYRKDFRHQQHGWLL